MIKTEASNNCFTHNRKFLSRLYYFYIIIENHLNIISHSYFLLRKTLFNILTH